MPGEQSQEGRANTALFSSLVQKFGWIQKGPIDSNVGCCKCSLQANGNRKIHGVDALFTLKCPFTGVQRGVLVDGKRYKIDSVGGPGKLKEWLNSAVITATHLRESLDVLVPDRDFPIDTHLDTAIVVWDCYEGWDVQKVSEWLRKVTVASVRTPTLNVLLSTKEHLDRLQTISNFKDSVNDLEFFIPTEINPGWHKSLPPEFIHSEIIIIRYKNHGEPDLKIGTFYWGSGDLAKIRYLPRYMTYAGLMSHENLIVHVMCRESELEGYEINLRNAYDTILSPNGHTTRTGPDFTIKRIARVSFDS